MSSAPDDPLAQALTAPEIPRLRIHHMMACVVVAAVQLSLYRAFYPHLFSSGSIALPILTAINSTFSAIALTLGLFSVYWRVIGLPALSEPGQYLLLGRAIFTVGFYLTLAMMLLGQGRVSVDSSSSVSNALMLSAASSIQLLVSLVFFVWCAWKVADTWIWRVLFIVRAIAPLISRSLLTYWFFGFTQTQNQYLVIYGPTICCALVQLVIETAAVVSDRRRTRPRSSTHWAGLLLAMISDVLSIVSSAIYWSIQR